MVVLACLGAVGLATVLTQEHRLVLLRQLPATALLVVLVAHQTGEVGRATLCVCVCVCVCVVGG